MFKNLEVSPFKSRNNAASVLAERCEGRVPKEAIEKWKTAWQVYKLDSFDQIPKLPCIRMDAKNPLRKRAEREKRYKELAVKHFLPVLKSRIPLLSGAARQSAHNAVCDLEHWRQTLCLPESSLPTVESDNHSSTRVSSTPLRLDKSKLSNLPKPPTKPTKSKQRIERDAQDGGQGTLCQPIEIDDLSGCEFENPFIPYEPRSNDVDFYIWDDSNYNFKPRKLPPNDSTAEALNRAAALRDKPTPTEVHPKH